MRPCRRPHLLVVVALAFLALAGCGGDGDSADDYEAGLAKVQEHLDDATVASRESGQTEDPQERRAKLGEAHEALDAAAREAEGLEPPDDAKAAHEDFAEALREYADLFDQLARLQANDPNESRLYTQAGEIADRLDKASRDLEKAGYAVEDEEDDS